MDWTAADHELAAMLPRVVAARTMALWNVTGLRSVNVPIGFGDGDLPIGMQIVARPWADETCLAIAVAYQAATDHHRRAPTLEADVPTADHTIVAAAAVS